MSLALALALAPAAPPAAAASGDAGRTAATVSIRGQSQTLHVYDRAAGGGGPAPPAALVLSGDLGWNGFSVKVAEALAADGFRVVGFNVRAYLASFTARDSKLTATDVPGDVAVALDLLAPDAKKKVVLLGISEGAGLAALAASDALLKDRVLGVVGFGLPDENELGWKWSDMMMYLTKKPPKEPSFRVATVAARLAPVPLASIFSTHDEYTPLAEEKGLLDLVGGPKRLWLVDSANHRFSDNEAGALAAMREALLWLAAPSPPATAPPGLGPSR